MTWYEITASIITGVGFLNCAGFILWYARRSRMEWTKSEHGWFLMYVALSLGALFGFICFNQFVGDWAARRGVAIAVFASLLGITFWLPRILYVSIRIAAKEERYEDIR